MDFHKKERYSIADLLDIMEILRSENGCPWDREQNHQSIRKNFIEETYEVVEAIDREDTALLQEELGDVLLQVVFHAQMEKEKGSFSFDDVADGICKKLILRHPHIFADVKADTSEEVLRNWDAIKKVEKGQRTATDTLKSVPKVLPALMRSEKVQSRAAKAGFDFEGIEPVYGSLCSEVEELAEAVQSKNISDIQEELGDVLFSVVNLSRFLKVDAEEALYNATEKFIKRFEQVERLAQQRGIDMKKESMQTLDELWKSVKEFEG